MDNIRELPIEDVVRGSSLKHIAFIMDGNGRWATARGLPREAGHKAGAESFKTIVRHCHDIGIRCCTVYAFSTENIKRPKAEVEAIFRLLVRYIKEAYDEIDVEFKFIGDVAQLSRSIAEQAAALEKETEGREFRLNIAFNYGGRAEIVRSVNRLIDAGKTEVSESDITSELYTSGCPETDLIVRTGNEMRISNFLIWQCAYAELYFSEKMWPDFSPADVDEAVRDFAGRSRRWGGLAT